MNRTTLNFWLDILLFVNFLAVTFTGAVLRWAVPRGRDGAKYFLDIHRHDWQDWHFWLAVLILGNVALHIVLHWNWIVCQVRMRFFGSPKDPSSCPD